MKYIVKGSDETVVNVDVLGEQRSVGEAVELDEAVAAPLVEEGKLILATEESTPGTTGAEGEGEELPKSE